MRPSPNPNFTNPRAKFGFQGRSCSIAGVGSYVPTRVLTNAELEKAVSTSDEWITSRTGIKERRIAAKDEFTSDLATQAALRAMAMAGVTAEQLDLIVVATITPDMPFPSTSALVQSNLGARRAAAFDIQAACSGFIYGLEVAQQFIMSRTYDTVLVIGAEKLSSIVDWQDRNTCVLFGDGAGAVVLRSNGSNSGLLGFELGSNGEGGALLTVAAAGHSRSPGAGPYLTMDGPQVYKFATTVSVESAARVLDAIGLSVADVDVFVPHQANLRIIEHAARRLGIPAEKVVSNVDRYGNTSAASIPICLDEAYRSGRIRSGDIVLMVGFGGGLSWGSCVMEWSIPHKERG
jgi:3-oxoacyl-[acyl-carrier-protein] synthase-3